MTHPAVQARRATERRARMTRTDALLEPARAVAVAVAFQSRRGQRRSGAAIRPDRAPPIGGRPAWRCRRPGPFFTRISSQRQLPDELYERFGITPYGDQIAAEVEKLQERLAANTGETDWDGLLKDPDTRIVARRNAA
jgi:hypothetical protein